MNVDASLFLALLAAHLVADFAVPSDRDVADKTRWNTQLKHLTLVVFGSYVLAGDPRGWVVPLVVGLTHLGIDRITLRLAAGRDRLSLFLGDQAAHLAVLGGMAVLAPELFPVDSLWRGQWGMAWDRGLALMAGLILTVKTGGVLVGLWVKPFLEDLVRSLPGEPTAGPGSDCGGGTVEGGDVVGRVGAESKPAERSSTRRGLIRGGRLIGELERFLIFFLVLTDKQESVAFLVAAKSVFRFGELRDRENRAEAEYITIGTLMSFAWGLVAAWATSFLLQHL